jgi:hypothetical protein
MCALALAACGEAEVAATPDATAVLLDSCAGSASLTPSYFARQGQTLQGLAGPSFVVQSGRMGCASITGLTASAGSLVGALGDQPLAGAALQSAVLHVVSAAGVSGQVAITHVEPDPMDSSGQTWLYTLLALDPASGALTNVCTPDADGRAAAIPLLGSWDQSGDGHADGSLSFYCTSGVIAKCSRWGYYPWQSTALAAYHQACTRMARADYCGNGETHTQEGTQIDLYDSAGIHAPSQSLGLQFEAAWTPQGAYCIARERWLTLQGMLSDSCLAQFELQPQPNPMQPTDLCMMRRSASQPGEVKLSDRTGVNVNENVQL